MTKLTLGTAGHIDHGKTALVEALTGTNTDRLGEEQRRGISIELGYARLELGDDLALSVVDVPGHERFVRTMVAGATGIDLALVCVACDDGVMPQTREHLAILDLLGVHRAVVALTKRDLTDDEGVELARAEIADELAGTANAQAAIVDVSVRTGHGLDDLRAALRTCARAIPRHAAGGRARLPIDRVFSLRGIGTVVTGTLWSGHLRPGDQVAIVPGDRTARIRSLQVHDHDVEEARGGGRVAAALVGVERRHVDRGQTVVVGMPPPASYRLDARLRATAAGPGLESGVRVEVLHGTSSTAARVVLLDAARIAPGADGLAQLRLERPLATLRGDRAVVRALAPPDTVAGATILDPAPRRHGALSGSARTRLAALEAGDLAAIMRAEAAAQPVTVEALAARGLLEMAAGLATAQELAANGEVVELEGGRLLDRAAYDAAAAAAHSALAARAAEAPLDPALAVADVVRNASGREALVARLERDGILARSERGLVLPGAEGRSEAAAAAARSLLERLGAEPFAPPRLDDALTGLGLAAGEGRALSAVLEREGSIVRLPDGLALTRDAFAEARGIVIAGCERNGTFTLAELRDATGSSRRYAQAILERLDADGVTRRVGDHRVLRRRRPDP